MPLVRALGLFGLVLGPSVEVLAQVPKSPDRIRETTEEILSLPEFRLFPRLNPGESASDVSDAGTGKSSSRFKSSRGLPGGDGKRGAGGPGGQGQGGNAPPKLGPDGEPLDRPGDGANGNNPENAEDALKRENEFPEAGKLDKLLDEPGFQANPNPKRPGEEQNGQNPKPPEAQAENGQNPNGDMAPRDRNPKAPPPGGDFKPNRAVGPPPLERFRGHNRPPGQNESLPAPKPRQRRDSDSSMTLPAAPVGALARIVGAAFHVLAWAILTVICGMILWLIVKAIRERERPFAFAKLAGGTPILDLEPAQAPGDFPADVYVAQALRLAEEGHYREAVVQLALGAMSRMERAGWVRFRRGMTIRDYLRGIDKHPAAHHGFHTIVRVFEPVTFGRREPTREHFDQSLKGYELGFGLD